MRGCRARDSGYEHSQTGEPARYAGGRTVIGNDIARRRHLWVAWVLELVGDVAWTREVVELQNASFAEQDDTLGEFVERYRPSRIAMDRTGMGENGRLLRVGLRRGLIGGEVVGEVGELPLEGLLDDLPQPGGDVDGLLFPEG